MTILTKDEIIRMAREAGCLGPGEGGDPNGLWEPNGWENVTELMFRFADLIAAAEREECAKVCDELAALDKLSNYYKVAANAIRARGEK
jgi:hypothetical protein